MNLVELATNAQSLNIYSRLLAISCCMRPELISQTSVFILQNVRENLQSIMIFFQAMARAVLVA